MTATVTIHAASNAVKVQLFDAGTESDDPSRVDTVQPNDVGTYHVHEGRSIAISEEPAAQDGEAEEGEG